MKIKKWIAVLLGISLSCWLTFTQAQTSLGQTLQINTRFRSIIGKPVWLLIIRDVDTGIILPYLFDIKNNQDFWVAFTFARNYQITVSELKFGPFAIIHNFCHLEGGVMSGKSMILTLTGDLTPSPQTSTCHNLTYNDSAFPIVTHPY